MNPIKSAVLFVAGKLAWLPPLAARIVTGAVFIQAGWGKFQNMPRTIEFFQQIGIPKAELQAPFIAGLELVGGSMVLIGLFARVASLPLIGVMVVALLTAHSELLKGASTLFSAPQFLYIVLFAWIFTAGSGSVSVDRLLCKQCAGVAQK